MARSIPMTPPQYRKWRFFAEGLFQQAINIPDQPDGDTDLENGWDLEPSFASPVSGDSQNIWWAGSDDDREQSVILAV